MKKKSQYTRKSITLTHSQRRAAEYLAAKSGRTFSGWVQWLITREMEADK